MNGYGRDAQRAYDNQSDDRGDADAALNEQLSELVDSMHKSPAVIVGLICEYSCSDIDRLDTMEAYAHLSDDWTAYIAERKRLLAAAILAAAKDELDYGPFVNRNRLSDDEE